MKELKDGWVEGNAQEFVETKSIMKRYIIAVRKDYRGDIISTTWPNESGEWVKYVDVKQVIADAVADMKKQLEIQHKAWENLNNIVKARETEIENCHRALREQEKMEAVIKGLKDEIELLDAASHRTVEVLCNIKAEINNHLGIQDEN